MRTSDVLGRAMAVESSGNRLIAKWNGGAWSFSGPVPYTGTSGE